MLILFIFPCIKKFKVPQHCRHSSKTPRSIQYYKTEQQKGQTSSSYRSSSILQNTTVHCVSYLCSSSVHRKQQNTIILLPWILIPQTGIGRLLHACVLFCAEAGARCLFPPRPPGGATPASEGPEPPSVLPGGTPVPFNTRK